MRTEEEKYQLIDQFLDGNLPESHEFFSILVNDKALQEEVNIQRLLKDALSDHQLLKVKSELKLFHREKVSGISKKRWIIGSLAGIITFGAISFFLSAKKSNDFINEKKIDTLSIIERLDSDRSFSAPIIKPDKPTIEVDSFPRSSPTNNDESSEIFIVSRNNPNSEIIAMIKTDSIPLVDTKKPVEIKLEEKSVIPSKDLELKIISPASKEKEPTTKSELKQKHEIKSYVFEPNHETWEVPNDLEKAGKLLIFDRSGKMMYRSEFNTSEKLVWIGNSSDGGILPPSVYVFIIEYTDGSTHQGTITISY